VIAAAVLTAMALVASCSSGDAGGEESAGTTINVDLPKGTGNVVLCKQQVTQGGDATPEVDRLVANLISQASLPEVTPYEEFALRCDNVGVSTLEAPSDYTNVEPTPLGPPQTAIRVSTDFGALVEAAPIVNFFAAPVGGAQFPTMPGFGTVIQQSADGSLSSGTRDPREGKTISEECQALPIRDLSTGDFTGKAQFFVNCGDDQRAWVMVAVAPDNGEPYFVQVVAQVLDTADAEALGRVLTTMHVDNDTLVRFTETITPVAPETTATTTVPAAPATTAAP
jgi:hypothetical protein